MIIIGILIFLYGLACLWAVSTEDFNYYAVQLGKFLRRVYDRVKEILEKAKTKILPKKKPKEKDEKADGENKEAEQKKKD